MIYSTTFDALRNHVGPQFYTQLYAAIIGLGALVVCLAVDYRRLSEYSLVIFVIVAIVLLYVLFFGVVRGGARRWIALGPVNVQPSEFAKIGLALIVATFFRREPSRRRSWQDLGTGAVFLVVLGLLIAREPDLGTAVTLVPIFLGIGFVAGMRLKLITVLALVGVLVTPVAWTFALQDYQKSRIQTFLDPSRTPAARDTSRSRRASRPARAG